MDTRHVAQQGKHVEPQRARQKRRSLLHRTHPSPRCANCDIEIAWTPTLAVGQAYCCAGCAQGGPCSCDYSEHPDPTALA